jgi:hypothetical protein
VSGDKLVIVGQVGAAAGLTGDLRSGGYTATVLLGPPMTNGGSIEGVRLYPSESEAQHDCQPACIGLGGNGFGSTIGLPAVAQADDPPPPAGPDRCGAIRAAVRVRSSRSGAVRPGTR